MDKFLLFDDVLKEKASKEILPLSKELDQKIDEILDNLPVREKYKRKIYKRLSIAAAILIMCTLGFSVAFPVYARNLPVISSVFQLLSERNIIDKQYITYSSELNLSRTSNGTTVTINKIAYDGVQLAIGYTVENKTELKTDPFMLKSNIYINGKAKGLGSGGTGYFKDKMTYVGFAYFDVANDYLSKDIAKTTVGGEIKIPNEFIMDLDIKEFVGNIKGNWNYKFKVSTEKVKEKVKSIKTNIDLSLMKPNLNVNELMLTPINTVLRSKETLVNGFGNDQGGYFVYDDKGRNIETKSGSGSGSEKTKVYYRQILFKSVYDDSKSLTFIPYTYSKEFLQKKQEQSGEQTGSFIFKPTKEETLNLYGITTIKEGRLGEYKITQIELQDNKTIVLYECANLLSCISPSNLTIIDSEGKKYPFYEGKITEQDPGSKKYTAELPPLSKYKSYKLSAIDYEKLYDVRDDLKFTIEIK